MLGIERGRIVDGVAGLPDRVMKYAWREVPRVPDSLYYYSVQLNSARFSSTLGKGGTLYYSIMSFELYARARAKVRPGQGANRSNEERDRKRLRPFLSHPYELATPYSWISTSLPPALRAQPLWNCSYSINFTPGANYHKIIGSPFPPRLVRSRAGPS